MENINFIPANELPVAEGDEVSVLCVENGELKQKSASGLGGDGNVVQINATDDYDAYEPVTTEMVEKIVAGVKSGHPLTINMYAHADDGFTEMFGICPCEYVCVVPPNEAGLPTSVFIEVIGANARCYILDDGRVLNEEEFGNFTQSAMPAQEGDGE